MTYEQALKPLIGALVQALRYADALMDSTDPQPLLEIRTRAKINAETQQVVFLARPEVRHHRRLCNDTAEFLYAS